MSEIWQVFDKNRLKYNFWSESLANLFQTHWKTCGGVIFAGRGRFLAVPAAMSYFVMLSRFPLSSGKWNSLIRMPLTQKSAHKLRLFLETDFFSIKFRFLQLMAHCATGRWETCLAVWSDDCQWAPGQTAGSAEVWAEWQAGSRSTPYETRLRGTVRLKEAAWAANANSPRSTGRVVVSRIENWWNQQTGGDVPS